jgi:hypothetical protein
MFTHVGVDIQLCVLSCLVLLFSTEMGCGCLTEEETCPSTNTVSSPETVQDLGQNIVPECETARKKNTKKEIK